MEVPTMSKTISVIYDGESLRPSGPLNLERNRPYLVTIEDVPQAPGPGDAWSELDTLVGTVDAPPDWAKEHDHYLYGSAKRSQEGHK